MRYRREMQERIDAALQLMREAAGLAYRNAGVGGDQSFVRPILRTIESMEAISQRLDAK